MVIKGESGKPDFIKMTSFYQRTASREAKTARRRRDTVILTSHLLDKRLLSKILKRFFNGFECGSEVGHTHGTLGSIPTTTNNDKNIQINRLEPWRRIWSRY